MSYPRYAERVVDYLGKNNLPGFAGIDKSDLNLSRFEFCF